MIQTVIMMSYKGGRDILITEVRIFVIKLFKIQ